jgi:signal transduction histidine kinase
MMKGPTAMAPEHFASEFGERDVPARSTPFSARAMKGRPDAAAASTSTDVTTPGRSPGILLAILLAAIIVGWLAVVLLVDDARFVIYHPRGKTGLEMFIALGQLFAAFVLTLSSVQPSQSRMKWVSAALLALSVGALWFGFIIQLLDSTPHPNVIVYGALFVRGIVTTLLVIGLVPANPPPLNRSQAVALLGMIGAAGVALVLQGHRLPALVPATDLETVLNTTAGGVFPGLTPWYIVLSLIPPLAAIVAVWGAIRCLQDGEMREWLIVALVLLAGVQLHSIFWPSVYTSVVTTTSVFRLGLTAVVIVGGVLELRDLARERATLLAREQERVHQLEDLNILKRDFSAMVAHELGSPLAAIGNLARMITMDVLSKEDKLKAAAHIQGETRILQLLVRDMQESIDVEREDFAVHPRIVPLGSLFEDARNYAGAVRSIHPITLETPDEMMVLADPERIGQVIRNLLNNAVRHTPKGTPIHIGAYHDESEVCIEVEDKGPGIDPQDRLRILEKFGRGAAVGSEGRGLGLYLSQRILHAHGTELSIASKPGEGACFSFRLKEAS